jgi:hypothetical protein
MKGNRDTQIKLLESEFTNKMQMKDKAAEKLVKNELDKYSLYFAVITRLLKKIKKKKPPILATCPLW